MTFYWRKSTVWPWERIFSQKVPENHLFWRQDFWITWLWRGLAPTILKIETFSACVSENLGHELSDEPWADLLKLSDWQPFEIFLGAAMENCKKRRFLLKTLLLDIFWWENFSRIGPCESWDPEDSENVVLFGRASFLTGVIAGQSQIMSAKVEVSPKLSGVQKKRHGHNFDFSGLKRMGWVTNRVDQTCYSFHVWKIKIVAVSFFWTPHFAFKKNWKITRLLQPISSL